MVARLSTVLSTENLCSTEALHAPLAADMPRVSYPRGHALQRRPRIVCQVLASASIVEVVLGATLHQFRRDVVITPQESDQDWQPKYELSLHGARDRVIANSSYKECMCIDGKHVPALYVLGAKNSGTSSLWFDLSARGVLTAPGGKPYGGGLKEWTFWHLSILHTPDVQQVPSAKRVKMLREQWLKQLPSCDQCLSNPALMCDFSVTNAFAAPMQDGLRMSPELGYNPTFGAGELSWNTAADLKELYGQRSTDLRFIFMVRSPLARLQSEWYHTLPLHNCRGCMVGNSFSKALRLNVQLLRSGVVSDWTWKCFYAHQLGNYLKHFHASQFTVLPLFAYVRNTSETSAQLSEKIGLSGLSWNKAEKANEHTKPPLKNDVADDIAFDYTSLMDPHNQKLVELLAKEQQNGLLLAGYTGRIGVGDEIQKWLYNSW